MGASGTSDWKKISPTYETKQNLILIPPYLYNLNLLIYNIFGSQSNPNSSINDQKQTKMQASSSIYFSASSPLLPSCFTKTTTTSNTLFPTSSHKPIQTSSSTSTRISMKASSSSSDASQVDYSSMASS